MKIWIGEFHYLHGWWFLSWSRYGTRSVKALQQIRLDIEEQGHLSKYVGVNIKYLKDWLYKFTQQALIEAILDDIGMESTFMIEHIPMPFQSISIHNLYVYSMTFYETVFIVNYSKKSLILFKLSDLVYFSVANFPGTKPIVERSTDFQLSLFVVVSDRFIEINVIHLKKSISYFDRILYQWNICQLTIKYKITTKFVPKNFLNNFVNLQSLIMK